MPDTMAGDVYRYPNFNGNEEYPEVANISYPFPL